MEFIKDSLQDDLEKLRTNMPTEFKEYLEKQKADIPKVDFEKVQGILKDGVKSD